MPVKDDTGWEGFKPADLENKGIPAPAPAAPAPAAPAPTGNSGGNGSGTGVDPNYPAPPANNGAKPGLNPSLPAPLETARVNTAGKPQPYDWGGLADRAWTWIKNNQNIAFPVAGALLGGAAGMLGPKRSPWGGMIAGGLGGFGAYQAMNGFPLFQQKNTTMQDKPAAVAPTTVPKTPQ